MRAVRRIFYSGSAGPFLLWYANIYMRKKKIAFIAMPDPARVGETGNGQSGKREAHTDSDRGLLCSFDPGIWRACVWLAEAFSVHLRNSRFERSSRQLSGTHRSPLTRPRPLHFLSPLPLLPLLAARVCLPSSPPAPTFRSRSCISCSSFRLPHHSAALSPPPPTLSPHPYPPFAQEEGHRVHQNKIKEKAQS